MTKKRKKRDAAVISYTMSRIRSKDTSIEIHLRKALWARGLRYRKHYTRLPGSPDIAFPSAKVAVFCDSTFWHGRDWDTRKPKMQTNRSYWVRKIEKNMARDERINSELADMGWRVLRYWDVEIEKELSRCVTEVAQLVRRHAKHP